MDLEDANVLGNIGAVMMTKMRTNTAADGRKKGRQKKKVEVIVVFEVYFMLRYA